MLLYLASRSMRTTVADVAAFYGVSEHHLGKVTQRLGRLGWIRNQRGPLGGVRLAAAPAELSVGAVVRAFEGRSIHLLECVDMHKVCVIQPGCRLRHVLVEAERRQMDYLDGVTIADLLPPSGDLVEFQTPPFQAPVIAAPLPQSPISPELQGA